MRIICYDSNNNPLKRFYQWDTNQTISILGIIMPPVPVFHFCNRLSQSALVVTATVEGNVIKAPVPNVLLEQAETIVVYMYEETPSDGSRTTHTITIPVIPRPKPNDYNYIDNIEYPSYAMLDARINEILASMGDEEGGLAELADMRIGVDGAKYQTAGEAIRSQLSEVVQAREDKNGVKYVALKDRLNAYQDEVEALSKELHYNYQNLSHIVDELINVNLDDYKTAGTYRIRSASDAETIQKIPENVAGRLTVMATTESGRVLQTYVTNSSTPRMYVRFFNGTEWKEWDKFASSSEVNSLLEDLENISNDLNQNYQNLNNTVEELTNGNLDDYKTAGNYKVLSADIAKTIQNIPEAIAGRLTVMVTTQTNRTLQIYVTDASTPKVYIRYFNGTKWNGWNSFANKTDILSVKEKSVRLAESVKWLTQNGDTTCLYLLPDYSVYKWITDPITINPTNQIKNAIASDKTPYNNGKGWKSGYRLNSQGQEIAISTYSVIGFIPAKFGDTLRFSGISGNSESNTRIVYYDENFDVLNTIGGTEIYDMLVSGVHEITDNLANRGLMTSIENMAYFRLSATSISDDSVITVNEPLKPYTVTSGGIWGDAGYALASKDFGARLNTLEETVNGFSDSSNIPVYAIEEVKRVAEIIQAKRTVGSLTFTAMSDFHVEVDTDIAYGVANNMTSCRDAGYGLAELQRYVPLDFVAMLGDYTWGDSSETIAQIKKDLTFVKNCMADGMIGIPNIWCTGNHDINYGKDSERRMTEDELYAYLTSNNKGTVQDNNNVGRNYGYIDFDNQQIRCIYLNTADSLDYPDNMDGTNDDAQEVTAIQAQWLVDTGLNLSNKTQPTEWGIVLLSHHCLSQFMPITAILTAYKDGTSGNTEITTNGVTTAVNYNFNIENRGEIICAIHGHDHNFTYRKISTERWDKVTEENAWLWSIGVPNVDTTRNNEKATNEDESYRQVFGEIDSNGNPVYYPKTQGTATSTSFCVFTIDRKNRKVYATAYGAGVDRVISY